jgi:phage terminase large subunit-like protein
MTREEKLELLSLLEEKERRRVAESIDCSAMTREEANAAYSEVLASKNIHAQRKLCRTDLFFLLTHGLKRPDADHDWLYARCREVQASPDGHLDLWARDHYKAVEVNEVVPTPKGWKPHGELRPGDYVYGPDGKPTRVVARTKVFKDADCFRVSFCDGYSVVVSGQHLWTVQLPDKSRVNGTNVRKKWKTETLETRELKAHVDAAIRTPSRRYPVVPAAAALEGKEQVLPLDPYVLGVWLGDGTKGGPNVTTGLEDADEMQTHLEATGVSVRVRTHSNAVTLVLGTGVHGKKGTSDVRNALRSLGILKAKRIPESYLRASESQRWALLQGLMDTDGSCAKSCGQAIFCNANEGLAEDVFDLAQSLGLKATLAERTGVYRDKPRAYWQVQFVAKASRPPFRLARKVRYCSKFSKPAARRIVSIKPVKSVPVSCIEVARKDGLYLIGRHLVTTHNSTIITFSKTIQDILIDPEVTVGIFSHTRPIAKAFLEQIKREFESNEYLKSLFPDVLYARPQTESPKWALDSGIIVKRKTNPKESTIEAWGLVDGQPTSRHFTHQIYDDVVTMESVSTPDQIQKTTRAWEMSLNLGSGERTRRRYIGTRYHINDSYRVMIERGSVQPRIYRATDNGKMPPEGVPNLLSAEALIKKRMDQGPYTYGTQMNQDPVADKAMSFKEEWLATYQTMPDASKWNKYLLVDPASAKKATSDYTVMAVIGLAPDNNYYLLDAIRDRLSLTQKAAKLFEMHRKWEPRAVGYEKYGVQADIEHVQYEMEQRNYRFAITELGGQVAKEDRIKRLIPVFEQKRFYMPKALPFTDYEGRMQDFVRSFITDEYLAFPVCVHDDMLDCIARIMEPSLGAEFPKLQAPKPRPVRYAGGSSEGWMA